jgi:integrase
LPKSKRSKRVVPVAPFLVTVLREHLAQRPGGKDREALVFTEPGQTGPIRHDRFYKPIYKKAVTKAIADGALPADKSKLRFHDLRHSAATNWLEAGILLTIASRWLGHSTIDLTDRCYSHVSGRMEARATGLLQAAYTAATTPNVTSLTDARERRSA